MRAALEDDFGDGVVELSALHFRNYEAYEAFMASDASGPDEEPPGPDPAVALGKGAFEPPQILIVSAYRPHRRRFRPRGHSRDIDAAVVDEARIEH